ncbi:MAG: GNAT family N-acetyltransferase [bacterium]
MVFDPATRVEVIRTYLELPSLHALVASARTPDDARLERVGQISPERYRDLYRLVGEQWFWRDRLKWNDDELRSHLAAPAIHVWVLQVAGVPAGFFELKVHPEGDVEVMYFGLAPQVMGRGLGGWMLTRAVRESFALGAHRVILNTCTLDAPHALPNYIARGFRIVREERYVADVSVEEG